MKSKTTFLKILLIILLIFIFSYKIICKHYDSPKYQTKNIEIVTSLEDNINNDSSWCGIFNILWNDLKNDLVKQDIVFPNRSITLENLNKETFTTKNISESSYYKIYGNPSYKLKKKIENDIKEKFNETSDILNSFKWSENPSKTEYFLYAMLRKSFQFNKEFTKLKNSKFRNYNNVKYFGINKKSDPNLRKQVKVMYYNDENNFSIKLLTKSNDEVIISRGVNKKSFKEIYEEIINKEKSYQGQKNFGEKDTLKIPQIEFQIKEEFKELKDMSFTLDNGIKYNINKAIQTINFKLNYKGGKVKSEAGTSYEISSKPKNSQANIRNFNVNDTFTILLKEKSSSLPYFAAKITDIRNVQNIK